MASRLGRLFSSPEGFRGSPGFIGLLGAMVIAYAAFGVAQGEIAAGRGSGSSMVSAAATPGAFWFVVGLLLLLGAAMVGFAWLRFRALQAD